jgi:hypothetical protein
MAWPGDIESVTITWMGGKQLTYTCNAVSVKDGQLMLSTVYKGSIGFSDHVSNERGFPLVNIQLYEVNRVMT